MVPNGDFSGFEKFEIPLSTWQQKFKDRSYINSYGMLCFRDIYNITTLGSTTGGYVDGWIHKQNAVYLLKSWYPYRDRNILKSDFNFDSMLHQDTFHFFLKNQYENSATNYFYSYVTFSRKAAVSKVRVCGKNLYPLAANLSSTTRKGAYYNVGGGGGGSQQNCWCIPSAGRYSWDCPLISIGSTTISWESCPLNNVACNTQGGCGIRHVRVCVLDSFNE